MRNPTPSETARLQSNGYVSTLISNGENFISEKGPTRKMKKINRKYLLKVSSKPSRHLYVQIQQWQYQKNV